MGTGPKRGRTRRMPVRWATGNRGGVEERSALPYNERKLPHGALVGTKT